MIPKKYSYLNNLDFLEKIDKQQIADYYVKITLLDWDENPIQEIQGIATGGTLSLNGSSSVRRTCSITVEVPNQETNITNVDNLFSINKKMFLEIGLSNGTDEYTDYPIIWEPLGLFIINTASISHTPSNLSLSLSLKDKMCLLDGSCGGTIPASTQFDSYNTIDDTGEEVVLQPPIVQIITEIVNHFGQEPLHRILVSDVEKQIKMVMRWLGDTPIYLINPDQSDAYFTTSYSEASSHNYKKFSYGEDIGFIYTDLVYTNELIGNPGDTVTKILDEIVSYLGGNYEYFYDVYGNFIFQEIKNYLNTTQAKTEIENIKKDDYLIDISKGKSVYNFSDSKLISSYSNAPQYSNIKNDYVIWGVRESAEGLSLPIRYHLAIDKKPEIGNIYKVFFYIDPDDGLEKAKMPISFASYSKFPKVGAQGVFYMDESTEVIYKWDPATASYIIVTGETSEEYKSIKNFPAVGETGVIYIDTSYGKKYVWAVDETSSHYAEIQGDMQSAYEEYLEYVKAQQEVITNNSNDIIEKQSYIDAYGDDTDAIQARIDTNTALYTNYISQLTNQNDLITNQNVLIENAETAITDLQAEYEESGDETLLEQIAEQQALLKTYIENLEKLENVKDDIEETIDSLSQAILEDTTALINIPQYKTDIENLEAGIENAQTLIENKQTEYAQTYATLAEQLPEYVETHLLEMVNVKTTDWRSELYLQGVAAEPLGLSSNYYYTELQNEWPKLYNLKASYNEEEGCYEGAFYEDVVNNPSTIDYYLDFIDSTAAISALSVSNIGRRSLVQSNNDYNCVFEPDIPDYVLIEAGQDDTETKRQECENRDQKYIQINSSIYSLIATGGISNGLHPAIKLALYNYTQYNESIQLSTMPIYHLEPNTRISVTDKYSDIYGDYVISSISIPLAVGGMASISATRAVENL